MTMQMSGSGTMRRFVATHRYSRYGRHSGHKWTCASLNLVEFDRCGSRVGQNAVMHNAAISSSGVVGCNPPTRGEHT